MVGARHRQQPSVKMTLSLRNFICRSGYKVKPSTVPSSALEISKSIHCLEVGETSPCQRRWRVEWNWCRSQHGIVACCTNGMRLQQACKRRDGRKPQQEVLGRELWNNVQRTTEVGQFAPEEFLACRMRTMWHWNICLFSF